MKTHWCMSFASLGLPFRSNIPWLFDTMGSSLGNMPLVYSSKISSLSKVVKAIDEIHLAQGLNYLKATGLHLCLLLNFGRSRLEIKRIVLGL